MTAINDFAIMGTSQLITMITKSLNLTYAKDKVCCAFYLREFVFNSGFHIFNFFFSNIQIVLLYPIFHLITKLVNGSEHWNILQFRIKEKEKYIIQ